jgi:PAS domain S-box-containing protein
MSSTESTDIIGHESFQQKHIEARYQALLETMEAGYISHGPDTKILYFNSRACEILGLSADEIMGKTAADPQWHFIDENETSIPHEQYPVNLILSTGQPLKSQIYGIIKSTAAEPVWVKVNGVPVFCTDGNLIEIVISFVDVTDWFKAEKALQQSHRLMGKITSHVPEIVFQFRVSPDGHKAFPYISDRILDLYGLTPEQARNNADLVFEMYHKDDYHIVMEKIAVSASKLTDFVSEHRVIVPGKGIRWHMAMARPEKEPDGSILWHGTASDITDRKQVEINLRESQAELRNTIRIKDEQHRRLMDFTHIVSHNLRSHTANLEGLLMLLKMEDEELFNHEYIQLISRSSDVLSETINHLNMVLDIDRTNKKNAEVVGLREVVQDVASELSAEARKCSVKIINEVDRSMTVSVIPEYLNNVLKNLITNGIRFRSHERDGIVNISATITGSEVVLQVRDNGLGIDLKRHGNKLFGMYKTFHTHHTSLGLGLFITKNQVQAMGGDIRVESETGVGSSFFVHLPIG